LRVTREHPRDHVLYAMALGTGLRAHELVALDVADVFDRTGEPKRRRGSSGTPSASGRRAPVSSGT